MITGATEQETGLGVVLPWPPAGAGDFADVAWVVAAAVGNGPGVRGLSMSYRSGGLVYADLTVTSPDLVRDLADRLGLGYSTANDEGYVEAHGPVGSVTLSVAWLAPRAREVA